MKNRIAILLFHPLFHKSRVNRELIGAVKSLDGVTIRVMYDLYPDFYINVKAEQKVLVEHDIVVWQHPFFWYSSPSLLKEWIDIVLEHGFAYGRDGNALSGKRVMTALSTGGRRDIYQKSGARKYTIRQLLAPFEQTAALCNMVYLPPFVVHGTHLLDQEGIAQSGRDYRRVIEALRDDDFNLEELMNQEYSNDINK